MARYDHGRRYRGGYGGDYGPRGDLTPWYPGAFWAGAPVYGWAGWAGAGMWGWPPYAPVGYGRYGGDFVTPRRRPEESPTYGSGGDEAVRRYARGHGFDSGYAIQPHPERGPGRFRRYDRGYRGRG